MYYFDREGLVDTLASRPLTSREGFDYVLGFFAYGLFWSFLNEALVSILEIPPAKPHAPYALGVIVAYAAMIAFAFGIVRMILTWLYGANGGDQDDQFVGNLLAVVWVTNLRYSIIDVPLCIALVAVSSPVIGAGATTLALVGVGCLIGLLVVTVAMLFSARNTLAEIRAKKIARVQGTSSMV